MELDYDETWALLELEHFEGLKKQSEAKKSIKLLLGMLNIIHKNSFDGFVV